MASLGTQSNISVELNTKDKRYTYELIEGVRNMIINAGGDVISEGDGRTVYSAEAIYEPLENVGRKLKNKFSFLNTKYDEYPYQDEDEDTYFQETLTITM